jgi:hypothetical protein
MHRASLLRRALRNKPEIEAEDLANQIEELTGQASTIRLQRQARRARPFGAASDLARLGKGTKSMGVRA